MNRLEQLQQLEKEDPQDPFIRYALALEYLKSDRRSSEAAFKELIHQHPEYLPSYYPAAHLMIDLEQPAVAEQYFLKGMEVAKAQNDFKTYRELMSAYESWKEGIV